jgi:hypothetical protein
MPLSLQDQQEWRRIETMPAKTDVFGFNDDATEGVDDDNVVAMMRCAMWAISNLR